MRRAAADRPPDFASPRERCARAFGRAALAFVAGVAATQEVRYCPGPRDGAAGVPDSRANAIARIDPATEKFASHPSNERGANVRQMLGRRGEAWGTESGNDRRVVIRTR